LVIAHPDDEVMWFGGLLLAQPEHDWTVLCCTVPRTDGIRAWKFFAACDALGARGKLLPFEEPPPSEPLEDGRMALLDLEPYDRIVTHGAEGEYGHVQHRSLSAFVHERWGHKEIWSCCPPGKSDYKEVIRLTPPVLEAKMAALRCYDHVLPYEGVPMTKWQALLKRYCQDGGWDVDVERYRVHR
jgi:LmbE family N-acetylglucosaminyl deacetylase